MLPLDFYEPDCWDIVLPDIFHRVAYHLVRHGIPFVSTISDIVLPCNIFVQWYGPAFREFSASDCEGGYRIYIHLRFYQMPLNHAVFFL